MRKSIWFHQTRQHLQPPPFSFGFLSFSCSCPLQSFLFFGLGCPLRIADLKSLTPRVWRVWKFFAPFWNVPAPTPPPGTHLCHPSVLNTPPSTRLPPFLIRHFLPWDVAVVLSCASFFAAWKAGRFWMFQLNNRRHWLRVPSVCMCVCVCVWMILQTFVVDSKRLAKNSSDAPPPSENPSPPSPNKMSYWLDVQCSLCAGCRCRCDRGWCGRVSSRCCLGHRCVALVEHRTRRIDNNKKEMRRLIRSAVAVLFPLQRWRRRRPPWRVGCRHPQGRLRVPPGFGSTFTILSSTISKEYSFLSLSLLQPYLICECLEDFGKSVEIISLSF